MGMESWAMGVQDLFVASAEADVLSAGQDIPQETIDALLEGAGVSQGVFAKFLAVLFDTPQLAESLAVLL